MYTSKFQFMYTIFEINNLTHFLQNSTHHMHVATQPQKGNEVTVGSLNDLWSWKGRAKTRGLLTESSLHLNKSLTD